MTKMMKVENKNNKVTMIENLQFLVLVGLIVAQCTVGKAYLLGQCLYLACNAISVFRCVALRRPKADLTKDVCCLAITLGLIIVYLI